MDSLLPPEMAVQAEQIGVQKVNMPIVKTFILALLAGAFIALGAVLYVVVTTGSPSSFGVTRLIGGASFSLGLILVIVGGAELFTGNNMIVMAWANRKISLFQLLRNWLIVYLGNFFGVLSIVLLTFYSKQYVMNSGAVGINVLNIAKVKCELEFGQAVCLGILCNILVCLAVWLCYSTRSISGKILCIILPVSAFVASGFEHSIANMYFIPYAKMILTYGDSSFLSSLSNSGLGYESITWTHFFINNLLPVTIGNIIGGAILVGLVYWFVFLLNKDQVVKDHLK